MQDWRAVWRKGFAPLLSNDQLKALSKALVLDDPRLIQGATTTPPPLQCVQEWPVEAGCILGFCGVNDRWGEATVAEAEEFFAQTCFKVDQALGQPAACRWFLNWFDETPRDEMRVDLITEVELELWKREQAAVPA